MKLTGATEYFREHMAVGDYLTMEGNAEMTWYGAGAARLGLDGQCRMQHFENLCRGLDPVTGEKLMVRDKGARRRICFFSQLSPPKDVSLLYLVGGDQRIEAWWEEAVDAALREIEAATSTRVRQVGVNADRATGNMVAAVVTHDASRALDPQLHTHVCIMNVTYDETEARWKSVQPQAYYRHQGYFREVCYAKLAQRMVTAGYELAPVRLMGFRVVGVPDELRERFSKRRKQILKRAKDLGAHSQRALLAIAGDSRDAKSKATSSELRAAWRKEAGAELAPLFNTIARASGDGKPVEPMTPQEALVSAEAHVFERKSVVDDRLLLREALIAGRGSVGVEELKRALKTREKTGKLVRVDDEIASRDGLEAEREFTGWANAERKRWGPLGKVPELGAFADDQKAAIRGILESSDGVVILQGDAGTGKTKCLQTIVTGIEAGKGRIFGCAPSSGAADILRREITTDADTLQKLLASPDLQHAVRDRVIFVDEAGLVSVREMRDLCRLAARNRNRLLLVGDTKQHHSVEAGDALRCLQEYARVPVLRLTEIRRQKDPAYRKAVARLAAGDAFGAFKRFEQLGAVREMASPPALFAAAATDYVRTVWAGKSCLAISPVWSEIHEFTREVRAQLRAAGLLAKREHVVTTIHSFKWTREERRRLASYVPGDRLTFFRPVGRFSKHDSLVFARREESNLVLRDDQGREHLFDPRRTGGFDVGIGKETSVSVGDRLLLRGNLKAARLQNGDLAEVSAIGREGEITLKDGRSIPAWFREFSHGYAATSHSSQGKTVDRGILLMADEGIAAGSLKEAYVSNSRFRESQAIYTTDKGAARSSMMRLSDRKLVTELVGPADESPAPISSDWRTRWKQHLTSFLRAAA